ncbi:DUF4411 family protein [Naasia aerilata]|uniref:DUF4411 family protein n=1 Tax=Naasia aerilata TaxID=1162966 RepID=A0ABN6XMP1_9MICO|nr:DUF4411 family protein [Naasia aerilata]BDZ45483.1 hypothetical protein GCM10025866_13920 [Naasia aerilata]
MYSIDTSVLITAWRDHYWPDVFPGFWERFDEAVDDGTFQAVEQVKAELAKRDDAVHEWAKEHPHFFVPLDTDIQDATTEVLKSHPGLITQGASARPSTPSSLGWVWRAGSPS